MSTTLGANVRTIGNIVYILAKCSKEEADAAEKEICKSPKAVATRLTACGLATSSLGAGYREYVENDEQYCIDFASCWKFTSKLNGRVPAVRKMVGSIRS